MFRSLICCCLVFAVAFQSPVTADDWSQWRGDFRDGVWRETGIITEFQPKDVRPKWSQSIGTGYSSPTVSNGLVFLMDYDEAGSTESIRCWNADTGEPAWQHTYETDYQISYAAGPRSAVTVHEELAYSMGAMGQLKCLQVSDGSVVWEKDLDSQYRISASKRMPIWGMSCSPLIVDDLVILQVGGEGAGVVAFQKKTGKEVWRSLDDRGQYSSPVLVRQNSQDVIVCWTGDGVAGLNPTDGKAYWYYQLSPSRMPIGVASPVVQGNRIFLTSFYDGATMLEMSSNSMDIKLVWRKVGPNERATQAIHSIISTPIWLGKHIYGMDSYGELRCLDADTGERVWEDKTLVKQNRWGTVHFVQNGQRIWMFNEQGELIIGTLDKSGLTIGSRVKVLEPNQMRTRNRKGGVCWSHPAFANKSVFLRNDSELVCIGLAEKKR